MFDLSKKNILVIGGRGYLGRDFCQKLSEQNAKVISADLPFLSHAASKSSFEEQDSSIDQFEIDVTDKDSVTEVIGNIREKYKRIDTLIYCATSKPDDFYSPFTECSLEGWQNVINVELDGLFLVTQQIGKLMESQEKGNIILLSSIYGVVGNDQRIYQESNLDELYVNDRVKDKDRAIFSHSVYPVVKGGVISLTRYLAAYWGERNIRVNAISPGGVFHEGENKDFVKKYSEKVPLGRKANVEEISSTVVFLSSDESSYINGQNIIVDGGLTSW